MDNAEKSSRGPSKGIFDTASLLAHSPSAFSVLGRTAVLVPPPSSNSDSPSLPTSSKICSPVIHQSASDALSSLASSSGPCGWWSASTPVATTAEFPGCGVSSLNDHYGRAGICGRSPISLGSSTHLPIPQPRRIVEEVLGHLYAKPPSAEVKPELQSSGIHGSHQVSCKTPTLSSVNLQDSPPKNSSKLKPNSFSEKEANSGKSQDKSKTVVNNVAANFPVNSTASGNGLSRSPSKKSSGVSGELNADSSVLSQSANSTTRSKKRLRNCNKNDKKNKESSKSKAPINRKSKEKKIPKKLSSDSESHADSTGGSSSSGGESGSSGVVSTSDSSDSSDEEVREKQQKELERLKKQQQELRRKVQELKQASQDSSHQKTDTHVKKTIASKSPVTGNTVNKVTKPVPSPAHSASVRSLSPKTVSPKLKSSGAHTSEDDVNMSVPLDLCMKKQEPTFEVTNSSLPTSFNSTNMLKNQVTTSTGNSSSNLKTPTVGKRRGRKPKSAISPVGSGLEPNLIHHLKQNMTKEHSLQIPHKLLVMPSENASNSLSSHKKSGSSTASSKGLCFSSSILDPFSTPRKDFTLDSLLSETNGTIDIMPSKVGSDMQTLSSSSFSSKVTKSKERLRQNNRMKRSETKSRELETPEKNDSSSETDSEPDNEYSDTDDTEKSASGSTVDNIPSVSGHGHKRSLDEDNEDSTTKRRRILPDEKDIQIPLEHGWRRQTKIRCFSRSGVRGEVAYYAPCGKKLRNYPEVIRYLIKHGISDINRENFSFSTKINVGEFLESTSSGSGEDYVLLSEQEVIARIDEVRARKGRLGVQVRKSHQRSAEEDEQQRLWEQKQLQHQLEQQAEEARRQKEHQRLLKQQERFERIEHMRIEREIRAQQLLEEQEMKRQQAVFLREQERERRRQHMILVRALEARKKQEERERKREEILYEKRMNKEKKLEQRRMELDYLRELKKPVEDMLLKDSEPLLTLNRIPGVKLCGKAFGNMLMVFEFLHNFGETLGFDTDSLPSLNTMQMAILNSDEKCEEELLSVIHHLLVCAIDDPGVPHCPEASTVLGQNLKDADITNNNVSEVLKLYFIAHDKRSKMCLWLQEKPFLSLNPTQKTEILAFLCNELLCSRLLVRQIDNNIENVNVLRKDKWVIEGDLRKMKMIQQRRALKMKQCNEDSKGDQPLADETEIGEGASNSAPVNSEKDSQASDMRHDDNGGKDSIKTEKEKYEELENEVANESGNESDDTQATGQVSDGEDDDLHLSNEELAKKVDKLTKQLNAFSAKLVKACHTLRGVTFGQDRYHRRYWVLPKSGGIFAESMESSVFAFDQKLIASDIKTEISMPVNDVEKSVLLKTDMDANCVKQEVEACKTVEVQETQSKHDGTSDESKDVCVKTELDNQEHQPLLQLNPDVSVDTKDPKDDNIMEGKSDTIEIQLCEDTEEKEEKKTNVNIFMPKFCDSTLGLDAISPINNSLHNKSDKKHASNPSIPADQNWLLHSPFFASLLAGNMLFNGPMMSGRDVNGTYFNLPKNDSNNPFGPFLGLQPGIMSPENLFKSLGEKSNNSKPWFSILPRMPCDENSLIHNQLSKNSITPVSNSTGNTPNSSSPSKPTSHMSHSTPVSAASSHLAPSALANMQMELLNGMPSGFFMHPFMMPQFGPTYQNNSPVTCASHQTSFTSTLSTSNPTTDFNLNLTHPPAASTPSSIPTPSATPGPTCLDSNSFSLRDSPSPSFAKRLLMEKMAQEYDKPQEIPLELQKGWWRITDPGQLKTLLNALHHRGIREKMLQKQLQKHFNYACNACSQGQNEDTDLEITDIDREISQMPGGAPVLDCDETWYPEVALRVDIAILEQVENLEEKVGGASMQIKGWKPPPKLSCESLSKFVPACEKFLLQKGSQEIFGSLSEKSTHKTKSSSKKKSGKKHKGGKGDKSTDSSPIKSADPILINEKIEIVDDSESKTQIIAEEQSKEESEEPHDPTADKINPVEEAKKRLLMVEAAIERRYLKPPLGVNPKDLNLSTISNNGSSSQSPAESDDEIHVPPGLLKWREAVKKCRTSSQLAMCLNFLENFTAWDKSIMRASCQFCHSGDNEDMLLLCDGCDKGYHTYCFKPKMETIPDGDWYCYECLNKATGDNVCVICGRKGKLLECETCPKTFHHTCLEPPLAKMPKGKWHCSGCNLNKPKKNVKKNSNNSSSCSSSSSNSSGKEKDTSKETKDISGNKKTENSQPSKSKGTEKKDKKEKGRGNTDLAPCSIIVDELEKHDDAWPFLLPVNTKQFPTYRKVIKKPMDISTMRTKLEASTYKSREEFAVDARLIFDNCETFNEDDSPVGQAGHSIRAFFETRWAELCGT